MRWLWVIIPVAIGIIVTAFVLLGAATSAEPPFQAAKDACAPDIERIVVHSDGSGMAMATNDTTLEGFGCVLGYLGAPESLFPRMEGIRAIDGTQQMSWGDILMTWRYDTLNGLSITLAPL
jgi:hypothetical protein